MNEQMVPAFIGAGVAVILGALILWWAAACRRGTFPRNRLLGIRTPTTLRDQEAWMTAHRAGAPSLTIAGTGVLLAALIAIICTLSSTPMPAVPLTFTVAFIWALGWTIASSATGTRAARSLPGESASEQTKD
ncbi:SdpI family protein [Microbacterium lacticum]